jgi:hypothetical protein
MGRRMSTEYPHISHNKPHSKETVKGHPEVISINLGPITKSYSTAQFNIKNNSEAGLQRNAKNTSNSNALHTGLTLIALHQQNVTRIIKFCMYL